ncbi:RNA-binding protein 12B isoform X1 [Esox lucius]|uniref:RRM domain-containing protein n=1 Tax=Esox lucius TaxID=8010 RepID=A0A6Q2XSY7_ESOLU|nr:RNA-binding protein 12B isoform X1 [Esox lucius]
MAVVIRLQGLRITAGSEDIRTFFTGLKIPDGGVHIIGGERQEAFIIFASDEDARRAMTRSGGSIKASPVHLLLSSRSEMQSILEESTKKPELIQKRLYKRGYRRPERECTIEEPQRKGYLEMSRRSGSYGDTFSLAQKPSSQANSRDELYLLLKGMPFTTTEENVKSFFDGLAVEDIVLMKNYRGQLNGKAIVKFKSRMDATEGLKRDRNYIGTRFVQVYPSSEDKWLEVGGGIEPGKVSSGKFRRGPSPAHTPWYPADRARSRSPVAYRSAKSSSPQNEDFCVLVENLPYSVQKKDIKEFFHPASLKYDQILHLHDGYGKKTRCVFVLFRNLRDYCAALTHNKEEFLNRCVYVSPISKEKMVAMLESSENPRDCRSPSVRSRSRSEERLPRQTHDSYECEKICLYVRNLPFDVRKVEIVDFFLGFSVSEENVVLLRDHKGNGLGEALVIFQSEEEAMRAQSLNGQGFLGANVILKCISLAQMREFGVEEPVITEKTEKRMTGQRASEEYSARNCEVTQPYTNDVVNPHMGHLPMNDLQVHIHRGSSLGLDSDRMKSPAVLDRDNGHGAHGTSRPQEFDGPTCLKLVNLPSTIKIDEIYDFCYGYRVIPGSVSLQYNNKGIPKGSATVVFESRQEALTAVGELNGRPIGSKKVKLDFV